MQHNKKAATFGEPVTSFKVTIPENYTPRVLAQSALKTIHHSFKKGAEYDLDDDVRSGEEGEIIKERYSHKYSIVNQLKKGCEYQIDLVPVSKMSVIEMQAYLKENNSLHAGLAGAMFLRNQPEIRALKKHSIVLCPEQEGLRWCFDSSDTSFAIPVITGRKNKTKPCRFGFLSHYHEKKKIEELDYEKLFLLKITAVE